MSLEITLTLLAVPILIVLSAIFSGSETALTAASRARMHTLELEGNQRARRVNQLLAAPERIIGTVLLGNNLVNILASALTTSLLIGLFGEVGVVYATIVVTALVVIFAEVLPKTYALAFPDRVSLAVAPLMQWLIVVLRPLTMGVGFVVRQVLKLTPSKLDDEANILAAHEEIRGTIELQKIEGAVARHDADMLGGVLDLRDLQVADIMVHRTKMETIDADDPPQKVVDELLRSQYTRVPIWKDEPENIVGVLHTKDLLSALGRSGWDVTKLDIMSFAVEPWFVPDTTPLKGQLNQFLKRKAQMALVVDEYGEVQGLITLEDILEEIVGQIADEHDTQEAAIRVQADGTVNVDGTVAIRDLNRHMSWNLPDEEATTVAGLVIHEAQTIPEPGQVFTFYGYRFEILRKTRNKITALRISPAATIAARAVKHSRAS
ncbi:MAG: HlyC/CorC family transporter [Hyphomicrobium sp.]|uniref:HlyC/CorC family transporter n=1 Tax=Hyphomicrobium sp. TaxID=82 RepID=UPI001326C186|nr:HlyC/CorC family transporter [Hyphomicrobium sp.]KAB2943936.1 MAG: HlyC/CorC family transporter [Hyphomicrobium sp.]MBZ0208842.1 HlyC/CorC family transporter [Hyphomicrobium sp.]